MVKWLRKLKHGIIIRFPLTNLKRFIREYRCTHPNSYKLHIGSVQMRFCNECGRFTTIMGDLEIICSHNILVR